MELIYYRGSVPNFGDDLNSEVWPALAPGLFADGCDGDGFVGIGTIIGMTTESTVRLNVFSSGIGYDRSGAWAGRNVRYHCVRGPVSARILGLEPDAALTDGAILTPCVAGFPNRADGSGGTIIVPHFETLAYPGWDRVGASTGFAVIDPRRPPHDVVARIASAKLVLTESLHGAILADTYGVPWSAFAVSRNFSMSKWVDWTASVQMPLAVTIVPPPDPQPLLRFGRRREPFGSVARLGLEEAVAEFTNRIEVPEPPRNRSKDWLKSLPILRPLMGFRPSRTAEALMRLAEAGGQHSKEQVRQRLLDRMLDRLAMVERR